MRLQIEQGEVAVFSGCATGGFDVRNVWFSKSLAVAGALLASAIGFSKEAYASAGCTSLNLGTVTNGRFLTITTGFSAGETISVVPLSPGDGTFISSLTDTTASVTLATANGAGARLSYTFPAATTHTIQLIFD